MRAIVFERRTGPRIRGAAHEEPATIRRAAGGHEAMDIGVGSWIPYRRLRYDKNVASELICWDARVYRYCIPGTAEFIHQ